MDLKSCLMTDSCHQSTPRNLLNTCKATFNIVSSVLTKNYSQPTFSRINSYETDNDDMEDTFMTMSSARCMSVPCESTYSDSINSFGKIKKNRGFSVFQYISGFIGTKSLNSSRTQSFSFRKRFYNQPMLDVGNIFEMWQESLIVEDSLKYNSGRNKCTRNSQAQLVDEKNLVNKSVEGSSDYEHHSEVANPDLQKYTCLNNLVEPSKSQPFGFTHSENEDGVLRSYAAVTSTQILEGRPKMETHNMNVVTSKWFPKNVKCRRNVSSSKDLDLKSTLDSTHNTKNVSTTTGCNKNDEPLAFTPKCPANIKHIVCVSDEKVKKNREINTILSEVDSAIVQPISDYEQIVFNELQSKNACTSRGRKSRSKRRRRKRRKRKADENNRALSSVEELPRTSKHEPEFQCPKNERGAASISLTSAPTLTVCLRPLCSNQSIAFILGMCSDDESDDDASSYTDSVCDSTWDQSDDLWASFQCSLDISNLKSTVCSKNPPNVEAEDECDSAVNDVLTRRECPNGYQSNRKELKEINLRWAQYSLQDEKLKNSRTSQVVQFESDVKVHPMCTWSYAYREARKGHWELYARDRARFQCRIQQLEKVLNPVLTEEHRKTVFRKLFASEAA